MGRGNRPDTSLAQIQVKSAIPAQTEDAYALSAALAKFVETVKETGRITITPTDDVTISIVSPEQYRAQVVKLITDDITSVTSALGPQYRVMLEGLDKPMKSFRSGDLSLSFYLPYSYKVIPETLTSYTVVGSLDDF